MLNRYARQTAGSSDHRTSRIAVVGAGPGGLACAVILASRGLDVTVYEAQEKIGGRTGKLEIKGPDGPQYRFDLGPTFFLMPHVLQEIFASAGRRIEDELELVRLDPMYRLVIGRTGREDVVLDATQDPGEMGRRIAAIDPADGEAFARFIAHNKRKFGAAEPILRRSFSTVLDALKGDTLRSLGLIKPHLSVEQLNKRYFRDPSVRLAVGFQSKYLGMSPSVCPSLFTILPYIEYAYGVWHPVGGCNAVMRALARVLIDLGGRIETSTPVLGLELACGRVSGVRLGGARSGEIARCDHAVINADATWALKHLVPEKHRGRWTDRAIERKKYSCSTYMLYLGVEGEVDLPHHTIRTAPDYERNLDEIGAAGGRRGRISEDPSFYVCNASRTDPSLAPSGHSSVYVLMPTPNTMAAIDWPAQTDRVRELLLDRIETVLGAELRGRIRAERRITPEDWRSMRINYGATFNLAHSMDQMLHRRPSHRLAGCPGAWLVGGGTHPGSGLPVIFLSAQITSSLVLDEVGAGARDTMPAPGIDTAGHAIAQMMEPAAAKSG